MQLFLRLVLLNKNIGNSFHKYYRISDFKKVVVLFLIRTRYSNSPKSLNKKKLFPPFLVSCFQPKTFAKNKDPAYVVRCADGFAAWHHDDRSED